MRANYSQFVACSKSAMCNAMRGSHFPLMCLQASRSYRFESYHCEKCGVNTGNSPDNARKFRHLATGANWRKSMNYLYVFSLIFLIVSLTISIQEIYEIQSQKSYYFTIVGFIGISSLIVIIIDSGFK